MRPFSRIILSYLIIISFTAFGNESQVSPLKSFKHYANQTIQVFVLESQLQDNLLHAQQIDLRNLIQSTPLSNMPSPRSIKISPLIRWEFPSSIQENTLLNAGLYNEKMFFCSAKFLDNIFPGKLTKKGCLITYAGDTYLQKDYLLLTGKNQIEWLPIENLVKQTKESAESQSSSYPSYPSIVYSLYNDRVQAMPVLGGFENDTGEPVYLCRTIYKNHIYIGKYSKGFCHFAVGNKEIDGLSGEVLFAIFNRS